MRIKNPTQILLQTLIACLVGLLPANVTAWESDNGDGTYTNPPLYSDYPDPDIIRVGEDFYFSTTTFVNVPGLTILHSKDLVNWEIASHVIDRLDGNPAYDMEGGIAYRYGLFASSLRYHQGIFYVVVTPVGLNTRIYSSSNIKGPWTYTELNTAAFDPGMFIDEDGIGYIATSGGWDGTVTLLTLNEDFSRVVDSREIFYNKGAEGSKLVKRGEFYYMFHSIPSKLALTVSRAKSLYGSWETKAQIDDTTGGHQGAIIDLPDGRDYGFVMVDSGPIGRMTQICPIYWEEGWPVWGTPDAPGRVPEVAEKPIRGFLAKELLSSDTFDHSTLGLQWQWNHNPDDSKWSLTERPGYLRLKSTKAEDFWHARNSITQKSMGPWCRGQVKLDTSGLKAGDICGFGTLGKINGHIAVHCDKDGNLSLWMNVINDGEGSETRICAQPIGVNEIYLRTDMDFLKETAVCSYSLDGQNWNELGGEFQIEYDWRTGTFQGVQFAIFCYNPQPGDGFVDVDSFTFHDITSTYETWIKGYFPETFQESLTGLWDDPDQDGINNATEFLNEKKPNAKNEGIVYGKIERSAQTVSYYIVYPAINSDSGLLEQFGNKHSSLNMLIEEVTGSEKASLEAGMPTLEIEGWNYRTICYKGSIDSVIVLFRSLLGNYHVPVVFDWFEYSGTDANTVTKPEAGFYQNPILAGFYPDPSICQVGDDYYLINSTFAYYPGLPIFHSKDLVNWEQIGHIIDRPEQLSYDGVGVSHGLFAPAITYYEGTFYVVCTMIGGKGNFVATATDPAGPWSDPVYTPFEGIDPSLFFDEDGRAWMVNNGAPEGMPLYDGHRAVWIQEFDPAAKKMVGPRKILVNGGVDLSTKPIWIEGPHLFKRNGWYYLSCAEGGTGPDHSQVILRSEYVDGPYEPWEENPILTQRNLSADAPGAVTCTGHADYVIGPDGQWWAVFLGVRPYDRGFSPMGRETFLLPMKWTEDDWPLILSPNERVPLIVPSPNAVVLEQNPTAPMSGDFNWRDDFVSPDLSSLWIMLREPKENWWKLDATVGTLNMIPRDEKLFERHNPSFLARRVQHNVFMATLSLEVPSEQGISAGLAVFQNEDHHYYLAVRDTDEGVLLYLERSLDDSVETIASVKLPDINSIEVRVVGNQGKCDFDYSTDPAEWITLARNLDATLLTSSVAGGFVGATVGPHTRVD